MVGQRPLKPLIEVRILVSQPCTKIGNREAFEAFNRGSNPCIPAIKFFVPRDLEGLKEYNLKYEENPRRKATN